MRIVCPDCQSAYDIKAAMLGDKGRMVKCADCSNKWFQAPAPEPAPAVEMPEESDPWAEVAEEDAANAAAMASQASEQPLPADQVQDDMVAGPRLLKTGGKAQKKLRTFPLSPPLAVFAALLAVMVLAVALRTPLVRMQPNLAGLFAAIGLPVNTRGLAIEAVVPALDTEHGRRTLLVSGTIRNLTRSDLDIPEMRLAILDASGKEVAVLAAAPPQPRLDAGATIPFSTRLAMPASAAQRFELRFARSASAPQASTP